MTATECTPDPDGQWTPAIGDELEKTLERSGLPDGAVEKVRAETLRVLSRCRPPTWGSPGQEAELVVGEVQSGKTLSFTSLIAAGCDNGFPLVVVLAGTKKNLRDQTYDRLWRDLGMDGDGGLATWNALNGPTANDAEDVVRLLERWQSRRRARGRVATVAVALKNHAALRHTREFMEAVTAQVGDVPVLFVDDEGDQAGLNIAKEGRESSTYRAIRRLREASTNHTYVLYTATPQAPLLIALEDSLSPRTVSLLEAGEDYVGGQVLFEDRPEGFVRPIGDKDDALDPDGVEPPSSLLDALATYLLALLVAQRRRTPRPLSMLIHPSSTTDLHRAYERWTKSVIYRLVTVFESDDPDLLAETTAEMFAAPYEDLASSGGVKVRGEQVTLDDLIDDLEVYLRQVNVVTVNSEDGREVAASDWKSRPGWIVIGGNKLDRGFTVENLAVTYMPRGPGVGNADTVQQRGRFFGYKRRYLDLLRAWLNPGTTEVYKRYSEHDRVMRQELERLDREGLPLRAWRRSMLLDPDLNPTRRAVIRLELTSHPVRPGWALVQDRLYGGAGPDTEGEDVLRSLLDRAEPDARDLRTGAAPRNMVCRASWDDVAPVLAGWAAAEVDKDRIYAVMLALQEARAGSTPVEVVFMNPGQRRRRGPDAESRRLLVAAAGDPMRVDDVDSLAISNLMQGADPADGSVYPGDRAFVSDRTITLQIHELELEVPSGDPLAATAVAIHLPDGLTSRVLLQG
ncbi:Z1 domain-containing protein [Isoptericola sp. b408]|uniref:Z1 domain-containing protein n=1 Tax=Isoptericola sp. b408 TaxID=3064653 RepID=UPI002712223F|nr:Z1 domain-containing protein [Isoptericola sp. b408]MDO8150203.1 Z1 domain-containing protein [Isoptericola sp. b408]